MIDREKVIKGLSECITGKHCNSEYCPYSNVDSCQAVLKKDALALLKEQETEIRQLKLALDIAKGTCNGIKVEGR